MYCCLVSSSWNIDDVTGPDLTRFIGAAPRLLQRHTRGPTYTPRMRRRCCALAVGTLLTACGSEPAVPSPPPPPSSTFVRTDAAPAPATRTQVWVDLEVGDCITGVPAVDQGEVTVTVVDCAAPHQAEVFLRAPVEVNDAVADVANARCAAALPTSQGLVATYLIDSTQDRTTNNPLPSTVICLLQSAAGQPLTGSARGG